MMRIALLAAALLLAACSRDAGNPAPPRIDTALPTPALTSTLKVPVSASLDTLETRLDARLPPQLWAIDEVRQACIKAQRLTLKFLGVEGAKITPDIACHITGEATRGRPRLSGEGDTLRLTLPIAVRVNARDADHVLKGETATAEALVTAAIKLGVRPDWSPEAKVDLGYEWQAEPSLKVLGITISLKDKADEALAQLLPRLEAELPALLAELHARDALEGLWAEAFTTVSINRQNPEIWLAVSPEALHLDPWQIEARTLTLPLSVSASVETVIGHRPPDPVPTPLPPPAPPLTRDGVQLALPVTADYAVLEPVLEKALAKLSAKGIKLPDEGSIKVRFGKVSLYPTTNGRIALGVEIDARGERGLIDARGTLWLAGTPHNEPGSQRLTISDLEVASQTDSRGFDLLVAIADTDLFRETVAEALTQDFSNDLAKLEAKVRPKLADLPLGKSFRLQAEITRFQNGQVSALGQGLYMPVNAEAQARLIYAPPPAARPAPARTATDPPSKTPPARS
ncbi:MAG: DUF4403 family protein [Polymorphobacter sp.]|uniref:DUF4403 family protein n=1 Tax=Polymorphobacter sp. TaxID=1909290 RepID=UPI003A876D12